MRYLPTDLCSTPGTTPGSASLLIDIHAHVFNGSDLQIADFIVHLGGYLDGVWSDVLREIGGLLQQVEWNRAPCGAKELEVLASVTCDAELGNRVRALREQSYQTALAALNNASIEFTRIRDSLPRRHYFTFAAQDTLKELNQTPYETYERQRRDRASGRPSGNSRVLHKTLFSLYDFVIQHFQYRFVNAIEYLATYETSVGQSADLVVTSFLDFDHWISQGRQTPTPIRDQIKVMERICVLSGGRVHAFVPYCPLRELETGGGVRGQDGQAMVCLKDAIMNRGFIGVKLYPPMGFAPYGNAKLQHDKPDIWQKSWLPATAKRPDFGERLDGALDLLYEWCEKENVPVMAHTSLTNAMDKDFEELGGPIYWGKAVKKHSDLRVNFGHIGGNPENQGAPRAQGFVDLMSPDQKPPAVNAYADLAYFFDAVDYPRELRHALKMLLKQNCLARERLMYGTDYQMIVAERYWGRYQKDFRRIIAKLGSEIANETGSDWSNFEQNFFGDNAVQYLGLLEPPNGRQNNRSRLEIFYRKNMLNPIWLRKLKSRSTRQTLLMP
jgi:predicted TIM-barrel fold metal-dependent hydrolase